MKENLKSIPDIERLHRSIILGTIKPDQLSRLFRSYVNVTNIIKLIYDGDEEVLKSMLPTSCYNEFNHILNYMFTLFDMDALSKCKLEDNEIKYEVFPILTHRQLYNDAEKIKAHLVQLASYLDSFAAGRGKAVNFDDVMKGKRAENGGVVRLCMGFTTSKTRAKKIKEAYDKGLIDINSCGNLIFDNVKDGTFISSDTIKAYCNQYDQLREQMRKFLNETYVSVVEHIKNYNYYDMLSKFVASIDVVKSHAKTAVLYNYHRPTFDDDDEGSSYVEAKDLRHALVERLSNNEYIPNDIEIGKNPQGILLYGANQIGKSTLIKALTLAIIMAQMGCFVPAHLKLRPYYRIVTRLTGDDNLLKGQSSFIVAMLEVRTMIRNADHKTLALGDELCRETESVSGTGITVATLETLVNQGSSFIFSTHMHHLVNLEAIKKLTCLNDQQHAPLRICHLHMYYDYEADLLIYDRTLKNGPGDNVYGIETIKYLGFDHDFVDRSLEVRRKYINSNDELLPVKTSRYNKGVYIDQCALCGTNENLESHHLKEQHTADKNGFIGHVHKNSSYNLIVLCRSCHSNLHRNKHEISSAQTSAGTILKICDQTQ